MAFPRDAVNELLVRCHRRCCICHRFCGVKIETDHIIPAEQGGTDDIDNAIPVCFECHAEIHSYNYRHPRGRKFSPDELRRHKEQWLEICERHPEIFVAPPGYPDAGPVQALIDELEFNEQVAQHVNIPEQGCLFHDEQFRRAIALGSIALLQDELKNSVLAAYWATGTANRMIESAWRHPHRSSAWAEGVNEAQRRIREAQSRVAAAKDELIEFLRSEPE